MSDRLKEIAERVEKATAVRWVASGDLTEDDALLIANAPEDLRYLLARVERLEAALRAIAATEAHRYGSEVCGSPTCDEPECIATRALTESEPEPHP